MLANFSKKTISDGPLATRAAQAIGLTLWVVVAFFLAAAVTLGLFAVLAKLGLSLDALSPTVGATVNAAVLYVAALAITIGLPKVLLKRTTSMKDLGLQRLPTWTDILAGPVAFIPYILLSMLLLTAVITLFPSFNINEVQDTGFTATNQIGTMLAFLTLVVAAPIAEEALFRGYLYVKLRRRVGMIVAILLTSLVFGLVHLQLNVALDVFALSVVLCSLRELTGSIWAGILLHMLKNGIAFYFLFIATGV